MLTFSHNHCGPRLGDDLIDYYPIDSNQEKLVEYYTTEMVTTMFSETVVDYALKFKKEYGAGTWVCGYADDMISYIPSRRVWEEGGYEGGSNLFEYGRPAFRWSGDIEDHIDASVSNAVKAVRK